MVISKLILMIFKTIGKNGDVSTVPVLISLYIPPSSACWIVKLKKNGREKVLDLNVDVVTVSFRVDEI